MKYLLILLSLSCTASAQFVTITPEKGTLDLMMETGTLGKSGSTQIFFIGFIKERDIFEQLEPSKRVKLKHGFVVVKLQRTPKNESRAYKLLDDLLEAERSFKYNIDAGSNWSEEEKKQIIATRNSANLVRDRFYNHVKFRIEKEAVESGISSKAVLIYE